MDARLTNDSMPRIHIHKGNDRAEHGCLKWNRATKDVFNEDGYLLGKAEIDKWMLTISNDTLSGRIKLL